MSDRTTNPQARSWIEVAPDSHFPIQNLPLGRFIHPDGYETVGVAIGDYALDIVALAEANVLPYEAEVVALGEGILLEGRSRVRELREAVFNLLLEDNPELRDSPATLDACLLPREGLMMLPPMEIGAFVDFYSSEHHASNVGRMFRPQGDPLLPNWKHVPIGYNGRASSVIVSGEPVVRPQGQTKAPDAPAPSFGPTRELDFELEMGFFVGAESQLGRPVPIDRVGEYVLGLVLVNDWSARDVQRWEYQPLGPFLAKSFATSISPWIVTLEALEPWRVAGPDQDPVPLPYLRSDTPWHFDIQLEVALQTAKMTRPQVICRTNYREMYWSLAQQLAHQASNGTNLRAGDLYASGTISGPDPGTFGSMLELSWKGERPLTMEETGETRTFLEDGDTVIMTGWCQGDGYRVGFGEVRTTILPAV